MRRTRNQHLLRFNYRGGVADKNVLPGYDGATSIDGITRAIHIATHAYMTGEIVSRATALKGASIMLKPPRRGSFIFELLVVIEENPATTAAAVGLSAAPFYDFIKTAFKRATGWLDAEPQNPHLLTLYKRKEPPRLKRSPADLDNLAESLEGSLQDAHRPIGLEGSVQELVISTSRKELVRFNSDTKDWVNTREEAIGLEVLRGHVTRYNAISRNGRAYVDQIGKVVPFRPNGDFPAGDLAQLTWSLHGSNIGGRNKLDLRVRRITSASGKVKRLLLSDCRRAPEA